MTRDGISCLAFHPSSSRLLIAAADKQGKVGLWDIDHPVDSSSSDSSSSSSSSSYDGILMFEPHRDYVSSLRWTNPHTLISGSYDGTVRTLDVNTGVWGLVPGVPEEDNNWSAGDVSADGSVLYLATSDGGLSVVDARSSSSSSGSGSGGSVVIANRKVNTLHLHANQRHLASSASDGSVAVWDVRNLAAAAGGGGGKSRSSSKAAKPLCSVGHAKSSQGAYWCPDGSGRLLSISFDDTLRVWQDPAGPDSSCKLQQARVIKHNNNTGRWVVPFRPAWSPAGDAVLTGDMKRGVALFDAASGAQKCLLASEYLTAIPSRLALHPAGLPVMAAATSSGRVHIWR
ncbi:hypothetical protein OEZ86_004241 [Tetradesmus obliquus]|nr:hypothetical protein OEZ86_004241 [Tetradesmus obliquus]